MGQSVFLFWLFAMHAGVDNVRRVSFPAEKSGIV